MDKILQPSVPNHLHGSNKIKIKYQTSQTIPISWSKQYMLKYMLDYLLLGSQEPPLVARG